MMTTTSKHQILEALYELPVRIISTSRAGRHNSTSGPIIEWL